MPPNSKYLGRPTKFGNLFSWVKPVHTGWNDEDCRAIVTADFRKWLLGTGWRHFEQERRRWILDNLESLRQYDFLLCWCPLEDDCHVDVIIELLRERMVNDGKQ